MQSLEKQALHARIDHMFTYHVPNAIQKVHMNILGGMIQKLAHLIIEHTPVSREQSMALTHLQEMRMCVNAAIMLHGSEEPKEEQKDAN